MPRRFAFQIRLRHSSRSCSNSHRSRSPSRPVFIPARSSIQAFSWASAFRFSRWRSSNPEQKSANDTIIGAGSYVGHETVIGSACHIYPHVTIRERSRIGSRVIIHSGAVIGADGFGFEMVDGRQQKIQQLGIVQIDDDVEIGANTTVDRARFGRTWIQQGVKIDNLVQIAHNVVIGKNTVIAAQTGIAGSVQIGQRVLIGGQVGIIGHIEIGDNTAIGAQSGISKNISGGAWWASPAVPLAEAKQQIAWVRRLGKLFARSERN